MISSVKFDLLQFARQMYVNKQKRSSNVITVSDDELVDNRNKSINNKIIFIQQIFARKRQNFQGYLKKLDAYIASELSNSQDYLIVDIYSAEDAH